MNIDLPHNILKFFMHKALELLNDLKTNYLEVILIPAENPQFIGHMQRCVCNRNPLWYRKLKKEFLDSHTLRRQRVISSLEHIYIGFIRKRSNDYMFFDIIKDMLINGQDMEGYEIPPVNEVRLFYGLPKDDRENKYFIN